MDRIKKIVDSEFNFSNKFGLIYISHETYSKCIDIFSEFRRNGDIDSEQYHTLRKIYLHYYNNFLKIKQYHREEPRRIAQSYIGNKEIRSLIIQRDKFCLCCGSYFNLSIDHIVPISLGGANDLDNLQLLCKSCNSKKGTKIIDYRTQKKHEE